MGDSEPNSAFIPTTEQVSPFGQVQEFVTKVWNHPLVDEKNPRTPTKCTLKARAILGYRNRIPRTDYFYIPVGSLLWNTTDESDYDYQLFFNNKELYIRLVDQGNEKSYDAIFGSEKLKQNKIDLLIDLKFFLTI